MSGLLSVDLRRRDDGVTIISSQSSKAPLLSQRAVYANADLPYLAHVCIMSSSGGMLQGDHHKIDISLESGAQACVTTQGATRIYGMESNRADHDINIKLEDNAYLEFLPGQIIPYRGSVYHQNTMASVHSSATMLCSEIITPGRVAMGELFAYDTCNILFKVHDENGRLRLADVSHLEPRIQDLTEIGILNNRSVVGSAYLLTNPERAARLLERVTQLHLDDVSFAASLLYASDGFTVRLLGDRTETVIAAISRIADIVRDDVLVPNI